MDDDEDEWDLKEISNDITLTEALNFEGYRDILILGGPGMGKSTLAINICKQWAGGSLLQCYNAVILLLLRDPEIQEAKNVKDLLLTLDDEIRENVYKEISKSSGKDICFILEGYDELPYHLQWSSIFAKLAEKLPECSVVCTSRPESCYYKNRRKIIKINGFDKESVDKYILKAFEKPKNGKEMNGKEMAQKLKAQIHNNSVVESILHIPINVAIVCLIFYHFSSLPETLTELYTLLCLRLILRHITTRTSNKEQIEHLQSLDNLPTGIHEQFSQLCYIACKGMQSEKVIFSSQDLAKFLVKDYNLNGMGLLLIAPTISVAGRERSYNFLHLTLQEFCAAWHISKLSIEKQIEFVNTYYNQKHFIMAWRFYSGITKQFNKDILYYLLPCKQVKSPLSDWKALELINIAYEAGSAGACQVVEDYFKNSSSVINLDTLESHAIKFILTHCKGTLRLRRDGLRVLTNWALQHSKDVLLYPLEDVIVQHCDSVYEIHISKSSHIKLMTKVISGSKTLSVLHIDSVNVEYDQIKCLTSNTNNQLIDFKMSRCGLNPTRMDIIGETLSHNKSIRSVDLSHNNISDDGVEKLVSHLINNSMLHHINLCRNKITEIGISHLRKLITRNNSNLTSIELSDNPLKDKGIDLLLQSLSVGVEHVGLCNVQMTQLSCQSLGNALHKFKSISFNHLIEFTITSFTSKQDLGVEDNYLEVINNYIKLINNNYLNVIIANLFSTAILENLEIRFTCIDSTACELINTVGQNKSIKTLEFYFDSIRDELIYDKSWATELAQYVQHNNSLTRLTISGRIENIPSNLNELLSDSLTINTSIKSMVYNLWEEYCYGLNLREACDFINKLKENSILEDLTLGTCYREEKEFSKIENCVELLNKSRDTKSIVNLKVNIIGTMFDM